MGFRDDSAFAPETYSGASGVLGRLLTATGQVANRANPIAGEPGAYDPETFGSAALGLMGRMRALQQQQAAYRPSAMRATGPLTNQIVRAESSGRATATNDHSSALGAGQFLRGTWLEMLAKYRPDLTGTPDELAAQPQSPSSSAPGTSSAPLPDAPQGTDDRARGLLTNEPMRLWPAQPPIFFPF